MLYIEREMEEYYGVIIEHSSNLLVRVGTKHTQEGLIHLTEAPDKHKELKKVLKLYTGSDDLTEYSPMIENKIEDEGGGLTCICSKKGCTVLYDLCHIPTNISFGLGSKCIQKDFDVDFEKKVYHYDKNGKCEKCDKILIKRSKTSMKNYTNKHFIKEGIKICDICNRSDLTKMKKDRIETESPDEYNLDTSSDEDMEFLKKDDKIYLKIPFEEKDKYKKQYNLKWDVEKKLWYLNGIYNRVPLGLQNMVCRSTSNEKIYLNIPYKDKDDAKLYGARWDDVSKKWYCTGKVPEELFIYFNEGSI